MFDISHAIGPSIPRCTCVASSQATQWIVFNFFLYDKLVTSGSKHDHTAWQSAMQQNGIGSRPGISSSLARVMVLQFVQKASGTKGCWHEDRIDQWLLEIVMATMGMNNNMMVNMEIFQGKNVIHVCNRMYEIIQDLNKYEDKETK